MLTSRKCSVCGVCVFCTTDCEQRAAKLSYARIACAEHMKRTRVPENLGASAVHYVMLPRTAIDSPSLKKRELGNAQLSQRMWEVLFHGAKHYMHLLLAASPSTVFEKTAFGMSVVLMGTCDNLSAGFQRLSYPLGQPGTGGRAGAHQRGQACACAARATPSTSGPSLSWARRSSSPRRSSTLTPSTW